MLLRATATCCAVPVAGGPVCSCHTRPELRGCPWFSAVSDSQRELELAHHKWLVGDTASAIQSLRMVLAQDPEHAYAHALLAGCLLDTRRIHAALHEIELALGLEPDLFVARYLHAQILVAHRRFPQAVDALQQLIAEHPTAPSPTVRDTPRYHLRHAA